LNRLAYQVLIFSYIIPLKTFDRGFLEWFGGKGIGNKLTMNGKLWEKLHTGDIYNYTFLFFISTTLLIIGYNLEISHQIGTLLFFFFLGFFFFLVLFIKNKRNLFIYLRKDFGRRHPLWGYEVIS
jgi:hypothetical protein